MKTAATSDDLNYSSSQKRITGPIPDFAPLKTHNSNNFDSHIRLSRKIVL